MSGQGPATYISDQETKVDFLRNDAIAKTIVTLVTERDDRPITIGVHGDWGAGKSSVLEMVESGVVARNDKGLLCLKFNGWQFQGFEDAKIALIEGVVTELIAKRSLMETFKVEATNILKQVNWLKAARRVGGLALNYFAGLPSPDQIASLFSLVKDKLTDPATFVTPENAKAVADELNQLWKPEADTRSVPDEIREFQAAFSTLLKKANVTRLVVLVDDLDRCLPETAIETLEAIRLFVLLPRTAFIIGADEAMIEYAVRRHFPELPDGGKWRDYPKAYLEKLIQVPFRIPAMGETETRIYVTMLLVAAQIGEDAVEFDMLLKVAHDRLSEPWRRRSIEEGDVKEVLGPKYSEAVKNAVVMGGRIAPLLARGTSGNPRQVKRFINALNLRLKVSNARGFGGKIDSQVLAKIMLAERYLPEHVFNHFAQASAAAKDGISLDLQQAEQQKRAAKTDAKDQDGSQDGMGQNQVTAEWITRPDVARWLTLEPQLGKLDLQPYLFVINDSKSFLGADDTLSPNLLGLLEKLCGGEVAARSAKAAVGSLNDAEVVALFKEIRSRALSEQDLAQKPDSLIGLTELVSAHNAFDLQYVEVLSELPPKKLGPWAAAGHEKAVKSDAARTRLNQVKASWKLHGGAALKAALEVGNRSSKRS
nr:Qat anti-phage system ATPase QatA [uncultured Dongia sp.]